MMGPFLAMSTSTPKRFHWEIIYPPPRQRTWIDPKTGWRMKQTTYRRRVESEEDLEKEEELNEASKSDSNTLPPDYTASDEETDSDLDSTARSEARVEELEDTCKRNF
ncbi:hypothetical protein Tco_1312164 [Tanacetum coccineum]